MTIQSTITLLIEIVFWATLLVLMTDFVNGFFDLWWSQNLAPVSAITPQLDTETQQITTNKPQQKLIPDPWELPIETQNNTSETQSNVLLFPTLRLLPPAKEVQTKRKRTTKKSTTTKPKSAKDKSPQKTSRSRKKAA
ncbi:hypothetical protein [Nostoc sp. UHCC 0870]|uniref:hypothetical protein n=1 Tax=Nostoc sp. UHCC 0870 TaxID=2914041 RepID=UPI001EE0DE74|nr:hypothetical protein [Nostoc sp. UHCC 0870]UKP01015.1 hypothetical protein L6494_28085 [Nostoc sp. UHCC 0870]